MLVGLAAFHGGTANAEEDFYAPEDGDNSTAGVDQGEGPPPLASANPNTIPPGPTRIKIDGIEPEAGPNYGNYIYKILIICR